MFSKMIKSKTVFLLTFMMLASFAAIAQPKPSSTLSNPLAQVLVVIMVLLALAIAILGNVVNSAVGMYRDKLRKERAEASKRTGAAATIVLLAGSLLNSISSMAQQAEATAAPVVDNSINGLSPFTFYLMVGTIAVEIGILVALVYQLKFLIGIESKRRAVAEGSVAVEKPKESWWWRINKSASKEEEEAIDLSHDYDGISELDNKLPPWWIAAFAITILFSAGYLWRYHVAHSAPLQDEELAIAITKANAERDAYLAKTASNVDENTVVMLDDGGVAAGKAIYATNCTPCHGQAGEGNTVGPNLTDSYWIHGGGLADVFKSIKYGWVEKGMRSWKDDFSPMQIAQLTSYVKSLAGTNPPNAKEPQGDLYEEKAADVSPNVTDSTKAAPSNR